MAVPAEVALTADLINLAVGVDVFDRPELASPIAQLLLDLTEEEASVFPQALANAIRAVAGDLPRSRALAEVALRFDVYEVVDAIRSNFDRGMDPQQLATAVTLATNPACREDVRMALFSMIEGGSIETGVRRMLRVRAAKVDARSPLEKALDAQVWPGRHDARDLATVTPLVYVAEEAAPLAAVWRASGAIVEAGGRIRRVSAGVQDLPHRHWSSSLYPIVTWSGKGVQQWRGVTGYKRVNSVQVPADLGQTVTLARLVNRVSDALPPGSRFARPPAATQSLRQAFSPDALTEGAFDTKEMIYLGGTSRHVIHSLAKRDQALAPSETARMQHWSFDQLIAVRVIQAFKSRNERFRAPENLVAKLRDIAVAHESSVIGLDAKGTVYEKTENGFQTVSGSQLALDPVLSMDEAFRPFVIGGGVVPDLLRPSKFTSVDPGVLAGTPSIRGRRISARSVAAAMTRPIEVVLSAYPGVDLAELRDAGDVGQVILSKRG